jgi:hypothetical protein
MIIAMGVNTADISLLNMLFTMRDQNTRYSVYSKDLFRSIRSLATTGPSAPAYSRNRRGRNRSILPYERHVPANVAIYSNPATRVALVADRWIMQNGPEDRLIQWNYLDRFLMENVPI